MTTEERRAWTAGVLAVVTYSIYLVLIAVRGRDGYVVPMLWTVGGSIVASIIVGMVAGTDGPRAQRDERDREIGRFGEYVGHWVLVVGALGAMILAMLDADTFWIANALYLAFTLSAVTASAAKIVAYRRGYPAW